MPQKYRQISEDKPKPLVKLPNIFQLVPNIRCTNCNRLFSNPGKRYEYINCPHCHQTIKNPTHDGY